MSASAAVRLRGGRKRIEADAAAAAAAARSRASAPSARSRSSGVARSKAIIRPSPRAFCELAARARARAPRAPRAAARRRRACSRAAPSSWMISRKRAPRTMSVRFAAPGRVDARGDLEHVLRLPRRRAGRPCSRRPASSCRTTTASGLSPKCSCAHILPVMPTPVCTSSRMKNTSCSRALRSSARRNSGAEVDVAALGLDRLDQDRGDVVRVVGEGLLDLLERALPRPPASRARPRASPGSAGPGCRSAARGTSGRGRSCAGRCW